MALQEEIESGRQTIRAESYSMSIGEIVNLYRDEEMVIRPEFQRLFRWKNHQKSRLIESILLGIPLPSIFVMQRDSGKWEVIDGLQRLSTILEFMGELRDERTGTLQTPTPLIGTRYLPSLENVYYDQVFDLVGISMTPGQRLALKRAKLDVKILLPESDETAKYELFDRLNAGGSSATRQEVRTAQLILRDPTMWEFLKTLFQNSDFKSTLSISDRLIDEGYDVELVCRFLALRNLNGPLKRNPGNIDEFLSERIFEIAEDSQFDRIQSGSEFAALFKILNESLGDDCFRRFDSRTDRYRGAFSVAAFECITVGVAAHISLWLQVTKGGDELLHAKIRRMWDHPEFTNGSAGVSASSRIPRLIPFAIQYFASVEG